MLKKLFLLILLVGCVTNAQETPELNLEPTACFQDDFCIDIEIVSEKADLQKGLMGREYLSKDEGMLFVFPEIGKPGIWMKNMKFSIDIIWLDENFRVVYYKKNAPPCTASCSCKCQIYKPTVESNYVLEVSENFINENNIILGQQIDIKNF